MTITTACRPLIALAALTLTSSAGFAQVIGIGTNPPGTLGYSTGAALARVLSEKAGIRAQPQPVGGSSTYMPMINRAELEFGFSNVGEVHWAYKGEEIFAGRPNPNLRLILITYPITNALTVRADSPAKKIADLKGQRLPSEYVSQAIFRILQRGILSSGGLTMADVLHAPVRNFVDAMKLLGAGRLDAALTGQPTGITLEVHASLSRYGGVRHLPIETTPEALKRMRSIFPGVYVSYLSPAPNMPGVRERMPSWTHDNFLIAGAQVSEDVVYRVTKTVHDNKTELAKGFALFGEFQPDNMNLKHEVPYHPGAIKFYKEIGQWPPREK
jgi:TRAP transporter TAXI family solute receptor